MSTSPTSIPPNSSLSRIFTACLLAFMTLLAPIASVGAATIHATTPMRSRAELNQPKAATQPSSLEAAPLAPNITATKTDSFPDPNNDGKADPGETVSYEINVTNSGPDDATGVTLSDTIDPNTTLVPGSLKISPLAFADSYNAAQDTPLSVGAPGVLANDTGLPAPTAVPIAGGATTQGGTVTLNADGSFLYTPPTGFTGSDTFTYTATNGQAPTDTATVTITIDAAPAVTTTTPTNGATGIATNTNIVVNFTEAVDVTASSFTVECPAPGNLQTFALSGSGTNSVTLNPDADLPQGTTCTVTVVANQVSDTDTNDPPDNMAANFVFSFTTDAAPTVTTTTPTNGATGVAADTNIVVNFSEPVNVTTSSFTIECPAPGNLQAFAVSGSGTASITLNPNSNLPGGTCTVTVIANQVSDTDAGDPPDNMVANFVFSFTTDEAPTVTATTPTNGAVDQAANVNLSVTFSEPVNVAGNWFQIVCTVSGTRNVADTVVGGGPTTFTIDPNTNFTGGESCTVTIVAAQVTDQDGGDPPDNMAANFVFSFSIDNAPTVTATVPTNGATQVANNTNVSVTFSEPVDVTGNWFSIVCATSGTHDTTNSVVSGGPTTFTINPNGTFSNGELCTATIVAAQVTDQDANDPPDNMAANFVFSFTIDQAPAVTTTIPTNGATGVSANTNITVNFTESVNATTASFQIQCPAPGNTQAFTLSASPSNSFVLDPVATLPEGVICTVTVFAAQITDADAGDPPDNMEADFVFSFAIPPRAVDDARNATGNIRIQTAGRSGFSTLTNDIGPGITVTAFDATSLRGGQVSVAADGTFTFNPRAGYEGPDSFNYTITNAAGSDVGTVNITIAGMIWFINNSATSCATLNGVCGRLSDPLTSLPAFEAGNGGVTAVGPDVVDPEAGDMVFIYTGSGGYVGPVTFEANQRVIGQGAQQSLQTLSGVTPATDSDALPATGGTRPSITTGGFNVVSNNQLYGLNFDDTNTAAVNSVGNIGTFIMADIGILNDASNGGGVILDDGGTVSATGLNTIQTRSGVGLNVTNTQISSSNITFRSISVGNATADADPAQGILLNNTGLAAGNGGLIVTANGGVCTEATPTCTGGRIQNTTGGDTDPVANVPGGTGISLRSTKAVSLTLMRLDNHQNYAIHGTNVQGFTLSSSVINGTNGTNVSTPFRDSSIRFDQLTGTNSITNSLISGGFQHNLLIDNQSGTSQITVSGNTIKTTNAATGDDGFHFEAETTAVVNLFVTNNAFSVHGGDHMNVSVANTADVDFTFTGNSFAGGHAVGLGQGLFVLGATFNGSFTYDISNNGSAGAPLTGNKQGGMIHVNKGSGTGTFNGRIQNNFIGNAAVVGSGSEQAFGIYASARGAGGSHTTLIANNTVRQYFDRGILLEAGEGAAAFNATVTANTVDNFADAVNSLHGIHSDNGILGTDTNAVCIDMQDNLVANAGNEPAGGADIRLRKGSQAGLSVRIPGLVGSTATDADNKITAENPNATTVTVTGAGYTGGAACTQPTLPAAPAAAPQTFTSESLAAAARIAQPQTVSNVTASTPDVTETIEPVRVGFATDAPIASTAKRDQGASLRNSVNNNWVKGQQANALQDKKPRRGVSVVPTVTPSSGETVLANVGTLPAGKTVRITFQVTINVPYSGGDFISNQGTVSADGGISVLTDDPAVGGAADPTLTPVFTTPSVSVADAQANEPTSGTTPMVFTISLNAPAPAGGGSVQWATADQAPGAGHAVAGVDYTAVSPTTVNFAAGEQIKTVSVNILADGAAVEPDETFLVNLSNPTNLIIADGEAIGTIKQGNAAGTVLISEIRTSGPGGAGDDFVEVYNNADTPHTVTSSDGSGGYGLFKMGATCSAAPVLIGVIPNGTVIPGRGHYLFTGLAYSLANYGGTGAAAGDQTLSSDIENDRNVGIFNTATLANLSSVTRLDAVGFGSNTGGTCDLLREGSTLAPLVGSVLEYSYFRDECGKSGNPSQFGPCPTAGATKDSNNNAADFVFVETTGTVTTAGQRLGAPGPQNLGSPRKHDADIFTLLLDATKGSTAPPNRERNNSVSIPNGAAGTMTIRRRFVNTTGGPVTRLRFRIVDISSLTTGGGVADLRALSSTSVTINGIQDSATCLASNGSPSTPCSVTVQGTTLEEPPNQPLGGALNSSWSAGTITLATPLANGASINLQFLLGVQSTGSFKFFFNIEALP